MNQLLNFNLIQKITGGEWITTPDNMEEVIRGGAFDTRALADAQIFFAWKGEQSDGHLYLDQLIGSGIRLIVVEKNMAGLGDIPMIRVNSSMDALHQMAKTLASGFAGKIVSITGSAGKTTTKNWLAHILSGPYNLLSNVGTFNNHIGCPITLLNIKPEHELLILEMGSSGLKELELLSSIAPADITMLLNVGHAHLGKFGSRENIYLAKTEIFSHQRQQAVSLVPFGDNRLSDFLPSGSYEYFGKDSPKFNWIRKSIDPMQRTQTIRFNTPYGEKTVVVNRIGDHVGDLLSGVLAVCFFLGVSWEDISPKLDKLPYEKGRAIFLKGKNDVLVFDDTYNANPESVVNMLKTICSLEAERYVAVVGNMAELEEGLTESSAYILDNIPEKLTDLMLNGETGKILFPMIQQRYPNLNVVFIDSLSEILDELKKIAKNGTVIGVKGSRSSHFERIVYSLSGKQTDCLLERCGRINMCAVCDQF